ncbi:cilia- and flagella-associated protein 100 isoform X4 [Gallus gallus]|uniref:cilia- and flagella-associated protein 100 isoform X4 n=1 Tax=Gallus gallus TaxID=9031 RepID=UPI001AE24B35|nr:cilia- and flagella-associated protein 100 isoform X4 [Gallus gallus]XP_046782471.1 cilia- and flagella-associated protein 100 isoform X4 [Gallus gallus]
MSVLSSNHSALSQETHSAYSAGTTSESVMPSVYEESVCESLSSKPGMETYLVSELSEEDEEPIYKNPFTIPPDIDIFAIRNKERKKAKAERERMKTMKIHEKMTYSVKNKAKERGLRKALKKEEEEENRKQETDEERLKALQECLSWKIAIKKDYPLEKETFRDYINDRREIFLLEYAIAVKREEIQKLEKIAKKEERKLEKAEYNLEKDIAIFDEFLKENHKSSVQALKIAEKESAAKAKKIVQIHAIGSQIMSLQSDITRFENSLREYKMYRDFLYQLSPKEWQEEYEKKHGKQLKTADKESASEKSHSLTIEMNTNAIDVPSSLLSVESVNSSLSPGTRPQLKSLLKPLSTENLNSSQDQESEICSDEDEEPELYFTDPQQLLSVFAEMEEQNFSYLCNFQETQKEINELQHTFINAQQRKDRERAQLKEVSLTLKSTVTKLEERAADLKLRVEDFSSEHKVDVQDKMLASLGRKVREVYGHCIGESREGMETMEMLAAIEKKLIELLDNLERIPPAKIAEIEKAKKRERRKRLREEKEQQQKQMQEERLQRALERAQANIEKKTGRRLMFRSSPPARKEKKEQSQEQRDKEKEEMLYYFT